MSSRILLLTTLALSTPPALHGQERVRLDAESVRSIRTAETVLRVGAQGVDTVAAPTAVSDLRRGEMLVSVTGRGAAAVAEPVREPVSAGGRPARPGDAVRTPETGTRPPPSPTATDTGAAEPPRVSTSGGVREMAGAAGRERRYDLGYEIVTTDRAGSTLLRLRAEVMVENGGLHYDPSQGAFVGTMRLGLRDRDDVAAEGPLARPVWMEVVGDVQSVEPVRIAHVNLPYQPVTVRTRTARDSVRVRIVPSFAPDGVPLWLPVGSTELTLAVTPATIAGFGLEKADLFVTGSHGIDSLSAVLTARRGNPRPNRLWVTRTGAGAQLRSSGVGADTVRLLAQPYTGQVVVDYRWPVEFLLAALLGGLLGGVLNGLSSQRRSDRRTLAFLSLQGTLTGVVAAVLYAVGINVIDWAPDATYGEALMFALAFIGGLVGPRIFDRFLPALSTARPDAA